MPRCVQGDKTPGKINPYFQISLSQQCENEWAPGCAPAVLLMWKEQTDHLQIKKALFDTYQVQLLLRPALEQFVALVLML